MDWIHCNSCKIQPKQNDMNFILTSCGHIFCQKCENSERMNYCKICETACSVTKLNENIIPEAKCYFDDPEEFLKKALLVMKFQKTHRSSLLKLHLETMEKYRLAKLHIRKQEICMRKIQDQNRKLNDYIRFLKQKHESDNGVQSSISQRSSSKQDNFIFTPNINDKSFFPRAAFNSASSLQNYGGSASRQLFNEFQKPNLNSYERYRNIIQKTPIDELPPERTPSTTNSSSGLKNYPARHVTSYPSSRMLPYSAFENMNITKRRNI